MSGFRLYGFACFGSRFLRGDEVLYVVAQAEKIIIIIIIIIVEEKRTYGYELRVTLHHCNMILYTVRKCNN